ncbi:MAG: type I-C CRISPR-associated protein Cas5 [Clostridiales bacterium]|nr:type I-C CRISPR-associated protein Cas5 [Clostridiales bacterium]
MEELPKYRNTVEFCCYADYGLFTDPVYKLGGEKCTMQIPPYEAVKGILMSCYWKPTITWVIDAIRVMNPIQTEVKGIRPIMYNKIIKKGKIKINDLSYYTYLKDCAYQVRAHFVFNENRPELAADRNENKHHNIAKRSIEKGGRRDIFFGARECQGYVESCVFGEGEGHYDSIARLDFGTMYHGITYADEAYSNETRGKLTVRYAPVTMKHGIIAYLKPEECSITRTVRNMDIKPFGVKESNFTPVECLDEEGERIVTS